MPFEILNRQTKSESHNIYGFDGKIFARFVENRSFMLNIILSPIGFHVIIMPIDYSKRSRNPDI